MNTLVSLLNQLLVGLQSLTIDSFLAISLVMYIVHKLVGYSTSIVGQIFFLLLSIFMFYKVYMGIYPIISLEFFSAISIFFTVLPVFKRIYRIFISVKQKVTYIAPDVPTYSPRFGYTPDELEFKKLEDKREQEKHKKEQEYFSKISKKLDAF